MKTATYTLVGGNTVEVDYDENAPCRICGYPVIDASMGGTDICPWCDMGRERPVETRIDTTNQMNAYKELAESTETEELCKCGLPIHPGAPCEEVMQFHNHVDSEYCRLLKLILEEGKWTKNRTGVDTIAVFGAQAKFDVDLDAFPILTTKKVWFKGIVHELLWFVKGDTNIKYLVDNDVHIWDEWAYARFKKAFVTTETDKHIDVVMPPEEYVNEDGSLLSQSQFIRRIKEDAPFAKQWGDLGEGTYGGMWRKFPYHTTTHDGQTCEGWNGDVHHAGTVDQLKKVVDKLKTNPDDRRMIVSAWHPYWVDHCALPPCHCLFHFNTEELTESEREDIAVRYHSHTPHRWESRRQFVSEEFDRLGVPRRRLNLLLYQRSCDTFLGVPFNITSYCLLLAMVAHVSNMVPGVFTHTYGDLHIYRNHLEQVDIQLGRTPKLLPKLHLNPDVKNLFDFKYEDITLIDYNPHPTIKAEIAV